MIFLKGFAYDQKTCSCTIAPGLRTMIFDLEILEVSELEKYGN